VIPQQTEVDGALDASFAAIEMIITDYWWAIALFVLAYWIRWYAVAKKQGHSTPEIIGAYGMLKHFSYSTIAAVLVFATIAVEVIVQLALGFDILGTLIGGLFAFNPTVWASFNAAAAAVWTGLFDEYGYGWGPLGILYVFLGTFGAVMGLRFAARAAREGLDNRGAKEPSDGVDGDGGDDDD
jgi:hypothetical protein